nr:MAG: pyrroloquinoline quinone-dependent dehydrogenase [Acidobacteriota bacterium]
MQEHVSRYQRRSRVSALCVVLAGTLLLPACGRQEPAIDRRTWSDYGGGPDNARFSTLDQITKENVSQLEVAWTYPTSDNVSYVWGPIVANGVMYVLARDFSLVALDAATGEEIWIHEGLQGIAPRGINYWESEDGSDRRLLYQRYHYLEALDARTGLPILSFGKEGAVNLREGLRRDVATVGRVQSSNPGKIFENLLILGSATGENYVATPGDIRAFDVRTGELVWQFHTIPLPGEFGYETWPPDAYKYAGGANAWGEITIDVERGIAFVPTGSPTYDYYGADRHGANLFGTSLLALNARTGERIWHFQMVHHDLWDYDNAAAPQLTTIRHNGRTRDVVVQAGKTGFLYVFDRDTGEPIWPIEERPVPPSDVPGEQAWPTQPFPTNPPPFTPQTLSVDDINPYVLTPEERDEWRDRIAKARNLGLFTPPAVGIDTVSIPGAQGGANWGSTAAHPTNGTFYVLGITVPSIYRLSLEPPGRPAAPGAAPTTAIAGGDVDAGRAIYQVRCMSCHGPDLRGTGTFPSLVDVSMRLGPETLRDIIASGRLSMPPTPLSADDMASLLAFLASPNPSAVPEPSAEREEYSRGPVVASGGAPGARAGGYVARGGMVGPPYPEGLPVPSVRYYTDYGMQASLVKPPYSTLTAYDLNTGTIKWQIPAGGDDPRAVAEGATDTGYPRLRTGIITTVTGLLFQAGLDGRIRAYDAETGKVLWTGELPAGSIGIPAMYEADGRQFLVVNATQSPNPARGGAPVGGQLKGERAYVAFALPKR